MDESSGVTMKVKFQLQRECQFGQQFKVVGSGSHFGDWDPSAALPLNWSEGHLWTTEVVRTSLLYLIGGLKLQLNTKVVGPVFSFIQDVTDNK